jgi:hypothetical protein
MYKRKHKDCCGTKLYNSRYLCMTSVELYGSL